MLLAFMTGMSPIEIAWHLAAGAAVLVLTFVMFSRGWVGGGDAKLAAATALWFGFAHLLDYLLYASIFGGVLTLALIQFRMLPLPAPARSTRVDRSAASARRRRALRNCARGRGAIGLSAHRVDGRARSLTTRLPLAAGNPA